MLVDDRVMPNNYVFTTLIGILGRVGHHQKAFKLFNQVSGYYETDMSIDQNKLCY